VPSTTPGEDEERVLSFSLSPLISYKALRKEAGRQAATDTKVNAFGKPFRKVH
jgi:hypothetical protein